MRYETIKSIILTVLVLVSIFLTWSLWTYQPKYDFIENAKYIQNVPVSDVAVDYGTVIRPRYIFIHKDNNHYGITDHSHMYRFMKEVKSWTFEQFENISNEVDKEKFSTLLYGKGRIEIIYPDDFPIEMYRLIFQIDKDDVERVTFDRMIIPFDDENRSIVYFVSEKARRVYQATVSDGSIQALKQTYYARASQYTPFLVYAINDFKSLFLPARPVVLNRLQYYMDELNVDRFKEALFTDPSFVKKDVFSFGEEYTDGSRLMDVDFTKKILLYVNPAARGQVSSTDPYLLQKSIDFVNDHGGWTDTYYFDRLDEGERKVVFRLFTNNYPVFSRYGMSEIGQVWGESELISYQRPLFTLEIPDRVSLPITLPSGYEVIEQLQSQKGIDHQLIDDVTIGYELIRDQEREKIIVLEPSWYCLYNGVWRKIVLKTDERRGDTIGLE